MIKSTLLAALVAAVAAKQDVRGNLGGDMIVDVHKDHLTDEVLALLQEHEGDHLGINDDGFFSIKLSPEGVSTITESGLEFHDTTDKWVNQLERNLESVCSGSSEFCASQSSADFHSQYQSLASLDARVANIVSSSSIATRKVIGETFEGRDMYVVEVGSSSKPLVYTMCTIHAREWLAPMYCVHMIEELVASGGHPILDDFQFAVVYMGNPDGYKYSFEVNSMWRKTRNTNAGSSCIGTDPNRNYEDHHCGSGTSSNPCSDIFCGNAPYSTNEVRNVNNYALANKNRMISWIDYHSFASVWLSPLGYKRGKPPAVDYDRMAACMSSATRAATSATGERFSYGPAADVLGPAAGASDDNFYFTHGIIYSYTVELRGRSFQPSSSNIIPSNKEIFAGTIAQMECVADIELRGVSRLAPPEEGDSPVTIITENTGISLTQFVFAAMGVGILSGLTVFGAMTYRKKQTAATAEGTVHTATL